MSGCGVVQQEISELPFSDWLLWCGVMSGCCGAVECGLVAVRKSEDRYGVVQ